MNSDEQELWRDTFRAAYAMHAVTSRAADEADTAVVRFRQADNPSLEDVVSRR